MSTLSSGTTLTTAIKFTSDTTGGIVFQTNGTTEAMRIDTSQNVGIGTSSPSVKLHVSSSGSNFIRSATTGTTGQETGYQIIASNSDASSNQWKIATNIAADNEIVTYDLTNSQVVDRYIRGSSGYRNFWTNGTERMRITAAGGISFGATGTAYGTSGQVLTSAGNAPPTWATPSAGGSATLTISNKTGAYTVVAGDLGTVINCTSGTFTVSLTAAATLGAGFNVTIWNTSGTTANAITIAPNGVDNIDGIGSLILRRGEGMQIVCNGTNWETGNKKVMRGYAENVSGSSNRNIATGDAAIAIGFNSTASNTYTLAFGAAVSATSLYSTAIGTNSGASGSQAVTGAGAMALGGSYASGADSFAAAIGNNTSSYGATGANAIAMGNTATASGTYSVALGGSGAIASATRSVVLGGYASEANATYSYAFGHRGLAAYVGKYAYGVFTSSTVGTSQGGYMVLAISTTDATATKLGSDGGAGGATNQVILANNSAFAFTGTIIARQQAAGGTASAAWKVEGLIRREANAASTTLVASTVTAISNVPTWVIALTADTTNGGLSITVTGAAATNIRWVATIQTSEVTYA
jgi:hypothetical protein